MQYAERGHTYRWSVKYHVREKWESCLSSVGYTEADGRGSSVGALSITGILFGVLKCSYVDPVKCIEY